MRRQYKTRNRVCFFHHIHFAIYNLSVNLFIKIRSKINNSNKNNAHTISCQSDQNVQYIQYTHFRCTYVSVRCPLKQCFSYSRLKSQNGKKMFAILRKNAVCIHF